ncbi:MAG TPA: histidine kinase [Caulobacteraceae bacterium]|nr:histidine kinase [Caulobacteraceae bacterium]
MIDRLPRPHPALTLTVGLWLCVFTLYTVRSLWSVLPFWPQVGPRALMCAFGALICGGLYLFLRPHVHRPLSVQMLLVLIGSVVAGALDAVGSLVIQDLLPAHLMPARTQSWATTAIVNTQSFLWVFLTWSCMYLTTTYSERLRANELRLLEAQALAADAQNRMLRYQINPHFLFNTLNALSSLVLQQRTQRAEQMLLALSGFLRYSLARSPDEAVPLREEARAQEEYLRIEQARFGERLRFVRRVDADTEQTLVPSLILQPLIENAVKYAVAPSSGPVTITLAARRLGDQVEIQVCDDGDGAVSEAPSLGVGLENVRRRLEVAYGNRAGFSHGKADHGYCARIVLPAEGG